MAVWHYNFSQVSIKKPSSVLWFELEKRLERLTNPKRWENSDEMLSRMIRKIVVIVFLLLRFVISLRWNKWTSMVLKYFTWMHIAHHSRQCWSSPTEGNSPAQISFSIWSLNVKTWGEMPCVKVWAYSTLLTVLWFNAFTSLCSQK